jgi:hypothetical protein
VNKPSRYEKRNDISYSLSRRGIDTGFLLKHPGDHHHNNSSNHSHRGSAAGYANNYNDAHERRLLRQQDTAAFKLERPDYAP